MTREIKFRALVADFVTGKRKNTFVYGSYVSTFHAKSGAVIIPLDGFGHHEIKKGTEGQFTGLKDKNGVEIYCGDIIGFGDDGPSCSVGMYGELGEVIYDSELAQFRVRLFESQRVVILADHTLFGDGRTCRAVYGNIHQNPELLK